MEIPIKNEKAEELHTFEVTIKDWNYYDYKIVAKTKQDAENLAMQKYENGDEGYNGRCYGENEVINVEQED